MHDQTSLSILQIGNEKRTEERLKNNIYNQESKEKGIKLLLKQDYKPLGSFMLVHKLFMIHCIVKITSNK